MTFRRAKTLVIVRVVAACLSGGLIFGLSAFGKFHPNVNSQLLLLVKAAEFCTGIIGFFFSLMIEQ
jgi:hypothetical protein